VKASLDQDREAITYREEEVTKRVVDIESQKAMLEEEVQGLKDWLVYTECKPEAFDKHLGNKEMENQKFLIENQRLWVKNKELLSSFHSSRTF
jgi:hypothetical protein